MRARTSQLGVRCAGVERGAGVSRGGYAAARWSASLACGLRRFFVVGALAVFWNNQAHVLQRRETFHVLEKPAK